MKPVRLCALLFFALLIGLSLLLNDRVTMSSGSDHGLLCQYTTSQLRSIRTENKSTLPILVENKLKDNDILNYRSNKTRGSFRGTRGGRNTKEKMHRIETIIGNRPKPTHQRNFRPPKTVCIVNVTENYRSSPLNVTPKVTQKSMSRNLKFGTQNARSVRNKTFIINDMIVEEDIDLLIITETWLKEDEDHIINEMLPEGYSPISEHRSTGQSGGGLLVFHKSNLSVKKIENDQTFHNFEYLELMVTHNNSSYRVFGVYRAPPSVKNKCTLRGFLDDFETFLTVKSTLSGKLIILGDLNIHFDVNDDKSQEKVTDLISSFGIQQHVTEATHERGHVLDVVMSNINDSPIMELEQKDCDISDHQLVMFMVKNTKPRPQTKSVTYKKTKSIDLDQFKSDIKDRLEHVVLESKTVSQKVKVYNSVLKQILDEHAPDKTKTITIRPSNGTWYTEEIRELKRHVRRLEKRYRRSKNSNLNQQKQKGSLDDINDERNQNDKLNEESEKIEYKKARKKLNNCIKEAKNKNLKQSIDSNKQDKKELFKIVSNIINPEQNVEKLPDFDSASEMASRFNTFFEEKISNIRKQLDSSMDDRPKYTEARLDQRLSQGIQSADEQRRGSSGQDNGQMNGIKEWSKTTVSDIKNIVQKLPKKTCKLDPIPTWLLIECIEELSPIIQDIVNSSLSSGYVPSELKQAIVKPLLKSPSLERNILKHYRPVSNLPTLSKVLEKVIGSQLNGYLDRYNFRSEFQSAYRKEHSTETALIKVHNDLVNFVAEKKTGMLVLLDLSAAFDTIDQKLLLDRLKNEYLIDGTVFNWFSSYLTDRTQSVLIDKSFSCTSELECGVPQGSVLGPVLFSLYTTPIDSIISSHDLNFHCYADDTQTYFALENKGRNNVITKVENCLEEIKEWMIVNKLKLNEDKTEIIRFFGNNRLKAEINTLTVANSEVKVVENGSVRNLGVFFDSRLNMEAHVRKTVQACNFHLKRISRIRHLLDEDTTKILMSSFVLSRIDYCNSLLQSSPEYVLAKLQKVQNKAARIVAKTEFHERMTPILKSLHWLPVKFRIQFKILCYVFKCKHGLAPSYLKSLINPYTSKSSSILRSNSKSLLEVPFCKSSIGKRSFKHSAPPLWNDLPCDIKSVHSFDKFRKMLKTYLFNKAFN